MDLPKVVIKDNYDAYLNGSEVKAVLMNSSSTPLQPGQHVLAFKDAISATTDMPVPKRQQSHYIGVEGTVTQVQPVTEGIAATTGRKLVSVRKL